MAGPRTKADAGHCRHRYTRRTNQDGPANEEESSPGRDRHAAIVGDLPPQAGGINGADKAPAAAPTDRPHTATDTATVRRRRTSGHQPPNKGKARRAVRRLIGFGADPPPDIRGGTRTRRRPDRLAAAHRAARRTRRQPRSRTNTATVTGTWEPDGRTARDRDGRPHKVAIDTAENHTADTTDTADAAGTSVNTADPAEGHTAGTTGNRRHRSTSRGRRPDRTTACNRIRGRCLRAGAVLGGTN